jgi:hypothetical protein
VALFLIPSLHGCAESQGPPTPSISTDSLLVSAVDFFRESRGATGMYRDRLEFSGPSAAPSSIAATGMGLISLCVGHQLGVISATDAREDVKVSVRTMLGLSQSRTASGFFYHFLDMEAGDRAYTSEYSSIDTAILTSGALFAASCLRGDQELDSLVYALWSSVDWSRAIADPVTGEVYLEMAADGGGMPGSVTRPFNEYMLVAWFASLQDTSGVGPASQLWARHYADPDSLPTSTFAGHSVLTDRPTAFLSSFVVQFAFYLCHPFTTSERYRTFLEGAQLADRAWWRETSVARPYEWGLGAGSARSVPYRADAIGGNPDSIVSPHTMAGFAPVGARVIDDLVTLAESTARARRMVPGVRGSVLWRYSATDTQWTPPAVEAIDYSTLMLGLAAHRFGRAFVEAHNDVEGWLAGAR